VKASSFKAGMRKAYKDCNPVVKVSWRVNLSIQTLKIRVSPFPPKSELHADPAGVGGGKSCELAFNFRMV